MNRSQVIEPALFAELRDLCLRSLPGRLDQRVYQVEPQHTYLLPGLAFTLSWREGARQRIQRLLLRRYANAWTWWSLQDPCQAQREWIVMRWLYGRGLPLPQVYAVGDHDGEPFLLLERPLGQTIDLSRHRQETANSVTTDRTFQSEQTLMFRQCLDALGKLLAQLHGLTPPDSVREALPEIEIGAQLERLAATAKRCQDCDLMEAVQKLDQDQAELYPPCVLHGDPQVASLTYDARGATAWLHWENSALGDPRWDVASVVNELQSEHLSPLADTFREVYARQSGLQLRDMAYWRALAAVHRWAMTAQARLTTDKESANRFSIELKPLRQQAWQALAQLEKTRVAAAESAATRSER